MSLLTQKIQRFLSRPLFSCIHDQGHWFTNQDIKQDIEKICGLLAQAKVKGGDRILLGFPNSYAFAVVYLAILDFGAVVVPFNPTLPAPEFRAFLQRTKAQYGFLLSEHWSEVKEMEPTESFTAAFVADEEFAELSVTAYRCCSDGWEKYRGHINYPTAAQNEPIEDDLAVLLYTSGTTGLPKGVGLNHSQIQAAIQHVIDAHCLSDQDVTYCFLPLFHINAQVISFLSTCFSGGRIILARKFSAKRFWPCVTEHQVTWVSAVPTVIGILLNTAVPELIPANLRFVRSASSSLPVLHARRFERTFGIPVIQSYGMSEAASQICVNPLPPGQRRLASVGLPFGVELKVIDEAGNSLGASQVGEIVIRGKSVITHYVEEDATPDVPAGWFHTGDLGYKDNDGYLYLTGRKKEMINRAGEKISPYEVEDVIREHPDVKQVAVIGLPDPLYGEQVVAYIVTNSPNEQRMVEEIMEYCRSTISSYKCPTAISIVSDLPMGTTGKIQRMSLKKEILACGDGFSGIRWVQ
ncbi:MAG: AMP-dependent synthetase and ligase [Bacilli bacterium]|nr:AMP-dependent synthetase and ligase [Bacilli bacterium]